MGKLEDEFVVWAKANDRWPLLFLLSIPLAYAGVKGYYSLTVADTVNSPLFLVISAIILAVTGVLFWALSPRVVRLSVSGLLIISGIHYRTLSDF